jgi:hypothetical protein
MNCLDSPRRSINKDCDEYDNNMPDVHDDSEFEEFKQLYEFDLVGKDVDLPNKKTDVVVYKRDFPGLSSDMFRQKVFYNVGEQSLSVLKKHKMLTKLHKSLSYQNMLNVNEIDVIQNVIDILEDCDNKASQIDHVFLQNSKNNLISLMQSV